MSLFSLANITFGSSDRSKGKNTSFDKSTNFGYDIYRYPIDLGSSDKGHYMMFHINKQNNSQITNFNSNGKTFGSVLPTVVSNSINFKLQSPFKEVDNVLRKLGTNLNFTRKISRVSDTVALYMPDTLTFTNNQSYTDLSLTGEIAVGASVVSNIKNIKESVDKGDYAAFTGQLSPALALAIRNSPILTAGFTAVTGKVVNPMLEMIYSSPNFREFRFDFFFYPRSEKEAEEVQNIINRFQFHQAPEIESDSGAGFFLIPPSEFDIIFYYNGSVNPNIPKISTCVLQSIDIDYAPNGQFSAYEVQGETSPKSGRTGMPVGIRMSLQFKETEIMTKSNFTTVGDNPSPRVFNVQPQRNIPAQPLDPL
jgi:hypothetical protein